MIQLAGIISIAVAFLALNNWRRALLAVIVIGVLQDALRKLTPGAPNFFIVWSMALYLVVFVAATIKGSLPPMQTIFLRDKRVQTASLFFLLVIFFQLVNGFVRWGHPAVPIFGALFYLGPPLAMLLACAYATNERRIRQFLGFYVFILIPSCLTVFLAPSFQVVWPVLRDVGTFTGNELVIYDVGTILKSYSGILRTGEISSWHAATAAMFLATLSLTARRRSHWLVTAILIALLIGVIVLTGRRKMLMALSIFFFVQWGLMIWFRKGMGKIAVITILVGTLSSFSLTLLEPSSESNLYVQRSSTVFGDATERMALAFNLMKSAFNRSGGIGLGAGSAAQGARYAGVDQSRLVGGSSESGLGMFMVELGVLGVVAVLWLMVAVVRVVLRNLRTLAAMDNRLLLYQVSFISFLFANLMTFTVATQIYGDFFVLIILGTVAGFAIRINNLAGERVAVPLDRQVSKGRTIINLPDA